MHADIELTLVEDHRKDKLERVWVGGNLRFVAWCKCGAHSAPLHADWMETGWHQQHRQSVYERLSHGSSQA